jgi:16S rRNA (cytosine967-C5)-methyltransferase
MTEQGDDPRRVAVEALERIDVDSAYANLVLSPILGRAKLEPRDRHFVTELVYGTTRMRRSCDFLVDRFLARPPDARTRAVLRLGAYQLAFLGTPPHAAVGATVGVAPPRTRGLVNAVLRKVAGSLPKTPEEWPDLATRLSYPDWIVQRLIEDLGEADAVGALVAMNQSASRTERADGYTQDLGSQWVAELVGAQPGELVADVCAAPGGKATAMALGGGFVLASDLQWSRVSLLVQNIADVAVEGTMAALAADALHLPYRAMALDRVLVDAPCSGLGALRRRPDARWRITPEAVDTLAELQLAQLAEAATAVRIGGTLVYSVCTLTARETVEVDELFRVRFPSFETIEAPGDPWRHLGGGAVLLPQAAGTDGMAIFRYRRTS